MMSQEIVDMVIRTLREKLPEHLQARAEEHIKWFPGQEFYPERAAEPKRETAMAMDDILREMQDAVDSETARQIQVFRNWKWKYGEGLGQA
jgi:hypothetical protein